MADAMVDSVARPESGIAESHIRAALKAQHHAAVAMLREAVELCPDELWLDETPRNAFWQLAYHTLYFLHLYLADRAEDFVPWAGHQENVQNPDGIAHPPEARNSLPVIPQPYPKPQVLAYCDLCDAMVDERVDVMDLRSPASGFDWYPISKLEHQLVTIRHTAHHAAQLADRVRAACGVGVKWVGTGRGRAAGG